MFGIAGFLVLTVLSSLCYWLAGSIARSISSMPRRIYIARLVLMVMFVALWWLCICFTLHPVIGDSLRPEFWYHVAWQDGTGWGSLMILAWVIVALIDWPKVKPDEKRAA